MKGLVLFFALCFSGSVLAQGKIDTCSACFAHRKPMGYTVDELAANIPQKPLLFNTYHDVVNDLGTKDGWLLDHPEIFSAGLVTTSNTKWFLENMQDTLMFWNAGEGITVAGVSKKASGDSITWADRCSYVYDEKDSTKKKPGHERVTVLDISHLLHIYRKDGSSYPVRILACLCCQNAVWDQRDLAPSQKPGFVGTISGGDPGASGGVEKPEKKDTTWIPEVGPIVTSLGKKPTSWEEQEYERQQRQQKEKQQGVTAFDSLSFLSKGGNYISNSFNTTNTYVLSGSSQPQDDLDGQYVYHRGSWVPASYVSDCGGPRIIIRAGLRVGYGINSYPSYCPSGLPYDGYWDGDYYRSALDGRTIAPDNRGNWQYQGGPSPNVDYSVLSQNRYKPETNGYTSNSYPYQRQTWNTGGHNGPRRRI